MELLTRPYLELPTTLTNKHRKIVYETCIHGETTVSYIHIFTSLFIYFMRPN